MIPYVKARTKDRHFRVGQVSFVREFPGLFTILFLVLSTRIIFATNTLQAAEAQTRDPNEFFFIQTFGDLPEELALAREQGKRGMLFFFESDYCPYCLHMRHHVFNQASVQDWFAERFLSVAIDIHGDLELKDFDGITLPSKLFSEQRRVFLTPIMIFVNPQGEEIYRHVGMVKSPEKFLLLGEYIVDGHYLDTEFRVFAKSIGVSRDKSPLTTAVGQ